MISENEFLELQQRFSDLLNYDSESPLEPIDPLNYHTPEGDSCLHIAAIRGDRRAVELLLNAGVDINQIGDMGNTALHYAMRYNHEELVKFLLENGISKNIKNEFGKKAL